MIKEPHKLQSVGVKRAMEAALWKQGIRKSLEEEDERDMNFKLTTDYVSGSKLDVNLLI